MELKFRDRYVFVAAAFAQQTTSALLSEESPMRNDKHVRARTLVDAAPCTSQEWLSRSLACGDIGLPRLDRVLGRLLPSVAASLLGVLWPFAGHADGVFLREVLTEDTQVCAAYTAQLQRAFANTWSLCREEALSSGLGGSLGKIEWRDFESGTAAQIAQRLYDLWERRDPEATAADERRWHGRCDHPHPAWESLCADQRKQIESARSRGANFFYRVATDPSSGALSDELKVARIDLDSDGLPEEVIRYQKRQAACIPGDSRPGATSYVGVLNATRTDLDVSRTQRLLMGRTPSRKTFANAWASMSVFSHGDRMYLDVLVPESRRSRAKYGARVDAVLQVHSLPIGSRSLQCEVAVVAR